MTKFQNVALRTFLFVFSTAGMAVIWITIDRLLQANESILILLLPFTVLYFFAFYLIPPIKNERIYNIYTVFICSLVLITIICIAQTKIGEPLTLPVYFGLILLLFIPANAMITRWDFQYFQALVLFCVSMFLFLPGFVFSLFVSNYLSFIPIFAHDAVFLMTTIISIFLLLVLFFRMKKATVRFTFIMLISAFPVLSLYFLITISYMY